MEKELVQRLIDTSVLQLKKREGLENISLEENGIHHLLDPLNLTTREDLVSLDFNKEVYRKESKKDYSVMLRGIIVNSKVSYNPEKKLSIGQKIALGLINLNRQKRSKGHSTQVMYFFLVNNNPKMVELLNSQTSPYSLMFRVDVNDPDAKGSAHLKVMPAITCPSLSDEQVKWVMNQETERIAKEGYSDYNKPYRPNPNTSYKKEPVIPVPFPDIKPRPSSKKN